MARTAADKRSRFLAAAAAIALLAVLGDPTATLAAASPGGSAPAGLVAGGSAPNAKPRSAPASRTPKAASIADARCVPVSHCSANPRQVTIHGTLMLKGRGLRTGLRVAFPRLRGARIARNSPIGHLHTSKLGLVVTVPSSAHSGRILVILGGGRQTGAFGPIQVVRYALHPPAPKRPPTPAPNPAASGTAFDGQGMWIWYLSRSEGGSVAAILARAHAAGVGTVFVKSSDGASNYWSQFSAQLVAELHAGGVKVCAWQYVYGSNPVGEANLGARAVAAGADCLVIDAEAEYERRYGAAQSYIATLRAQIDPNYPLGLAGFPYVDYHESFPYSVFLGPGGAQYNAPQMYWKAIGTSVATVFAHTFQQNLIYGRPLFPLGQTYENPASADLVGFRSLTQAYGASGLSWWDWQETSTAGWEALAAPLDPTWTLPSPELTSPLLAEGAKGDQVLWLQEHLASAIAGQPTTGIFDAQTAANLQQFQSSHGLEASAKTDPNTWAALLALPPVAVDWTGGGPSG